MDDPEANDGQVLEAEGRFVLPTGVVQLILSLFTLCAINEVFDEVNGARIDWPTAIVILLGMGAAMVFGALTEWRRHQGERTRP